VGVTNYFVIFGGLGFSAAKKSQKQRYIVRFLLAAENILLYSMVLTGR
jgi:hypothetical protein